MSCGTDGETVGVSLAEAMRDLREVLGMTQGEFSDRLGVSRSYVAGMETGIRVPAFPVFFELRRQFGFSLDALVDRVIEKDAP